MALRIAECRSPNHDARPEGAAIDILVLHYTGMRTAEEALARLCDPEAKVSAHYTIGRDGRVYRHVPEERRAWHAGVSWWAGERNVNARSIGIELVNRGHEFGYEPFPEAQISALIDLAHGILSRHPIPASRVIGHSDVAPARKTDPGELFPWPQLAEFGIGLWPEFSPFGSGDDVSGRDFARLGYGLAPDVDIPFEAVVSAFQRHWRPSKVDGVLDDETAYRLGTLISALP
jgi:N-acetylmuramoyl-L-alanine amidase